MLAGRDHDVEYNGHQAGSASLMSAMPVDDNHDEITGGVTCSERARKSTAFKVGVCVGALALIGVVVGIAMGKPTMATGALPDPHPAQAFEFSNPVQVASSAASVAAFCASGVQEAEERVLEAKSGNAVLRNLNDADIAISNVAAMSSVLQNAHPDASIRTAATECSSSLQAFSDSVGFDGQLASQLLQLMNGPEFHGVGPADDAVNSTAALALRYLKDAVRGYRTSGVLPPAGAPPSLRTPPVQLLKNMSAEMLLLGNAFEAAMAEDVRSLRIPQAQVPARCAGLPADFVAARRAAALGVPSSQPGQSPQDVVLDTTYPAYYPVLKYAADRSLRRDMFRLSNTRGTPDNLQRLARLLQLRWEYARLLGFQNWAELQLQDKMQGNPANTTAFLGKVYDALRPAATQDVAQLQSLLDADLAGGGTGGDTSPRLQSYDSSFYTNARREQCFQLDPQEVRQYFTYSKARAGVLGTASALFGVQFRVVAPVWGVAYGRGNETREAFDAWATGVMDANAVQRWSDGVEVLDVYSSRPSALARKVDDVLQHDVSKAGSPTLDGACEGYLRSGSCRRDADCTPGADAPLPLHMGPPAWAVQEGGVAAPANPPGCYMGPGELLGRVYLDMWPREGKYQHAAQFELRSGVAGQQAPEGVLLTNFPATGSMEHSQVETFFHEFGHLMHHVVGGANSVLQSYSGVATEWDFVEAPSQMLEAWAWDTTVLQAFASDAAGAAIPATLVSQMVAASALGRAMSNQQQVFYAQLSLGLHTTDPAAFRDDADGTAGNATTTAFTQAVQAQWSPFPFVPGTAFQASFGHLVGYGAIYSTYLWSNVIARDLLSKFTHAPFQLLDASVAEQYTHRIIAQGGRADASKLLDAFLQRPVQFAAFQGWVAEGASATCTARE